MFAKEKDKRQFVDILDEIEDCKLGSDNSQEHSSKDKLPSIDVDTWWREMKDSKEQLKNKNIVTNIEIEEVSEPKHRNIG